MAFVHGKGSYCSLDSVDLSTFVNNTEYTNSADSHDTTTYGKNAHTFQGGLKNGTATISGIYEDGATGPRATIQPLIGTVVAFVWRPEGTGTGLPEDTVNVLVTSYQETSPVADMITWTAELQLTDDVTTIDQV
ncbi:hypothetical protein [Prauserella shujinwangii]|uniref:hypothetical protein n=1 Tax=Prauserella shujinwangii TaxID=1453103 RepID=UPI000D06C9F7|nr:hypothetical protein [Prauserella shujinwangii]